MRTIWKRAPVLRLMIPWVIGLFLADTWNNWMMPLIILICCLTVVVVGYWAYQLWYMQRHWLGMAILGCALSFGWMFGLYRQSCLFPDVDIVPHQKLWTLKLTERPVERTKSYRCAAELVCSINDSVSQCESGNVLVYLQKCQALDMLQVDDVVLVYGRLQMLAPPRSPGEFDLQTHGRRKGVYLQVYADSTHWQMGWKPSNHSVRYYLEEWRKKALSYLHVLHHDPKEYGVLAALILGDTSDMDPELMTSYAAAGVVHVLAVSGLHVGLVYMLLAPVFKRLFGRSRAKWWRTFLPIVLLWLYSGLSGGSPSVLRAAVMFSGFIVADNFGKHNNIYNTLASSALVLLVVRPAMLFDLGFQLSYLAVIGIVILQQPLSNLIHVPNKVLDKVWTMSAVSIAAQLSTLPLTLYYFHQFPNYFLACNLFVIPWSTLIIYLSIVFFIALPWQSVAHMIADLLVWMTRCMNYVIVWFEQLPYSVTTNIRCDIWQFWFLSLGIFLGLRWLFWRKKTALIGLLAVCALHLGYVWINESQQCGSEELLLYSNGHSVGVAHRKVSDLRWYNFGQEEVDPGYGWSNYLRENNIERVDSSRTNATSTCPLYCWENTVVYIADSSAIRRYGWVDCDVMILHHLGRFRFDAKKMDVVKDVQVIFGPGIPWKSKRWIRNKWKDRLECIDLTKGTWVIDSGRFMPYSKDVF
jgi:competence protein ComEC